MRGFKKLMLMATFSARNSNHPPPHSKPLIKWFAFGFGLCVGSEGGWKAPRSKLKLHGASFAISSLVSEQIGTDSCCNHILADVPPADENSLKQYNTSVGNERLGGVIFRMFMHSYIALEQGSDWLECCYARGGGAAQYRPPGAK
jgi:hypothetical protein